MRILFVGAFGAEHRDAMVRGFQECGATVDTYDYSWLAFSQRLTIRAQRRFGIGPMFLVLARGVVAAARRCRPDVIFMRRPLEFSPTTLRYVRKRTAALLASFNNDDPFSALHDTRPWRRLRAAIPLFDVHFAFRRCNVADYRAHGAREVSLWEPFYSPWLHHPIAETSQGHARTVLFAMHAERDGRREAVLALRAAGMQVHVHCWNWHQVFGRDDANVCPPIVGADYARAIGQASATLCFFSKRNNDELTSRVFEIPACRGLLLAERNPRVAALFGDGEEAMFFSDQAELIAKVRLLWDNPAMVEAMKDAGRRRLLASRHSVVDRCSDALEVFRGLQACSRRSA